MNNDYEAFCMADPLFYESPGVVGVAPDANTWASRPAPDGWERTADDHWVSYSPEIHEVPPQGWKVHVSGRVDNAVRIIEAVWSYCVPRGQAFKFLVGPRVALARNAKYAGRSGSGKLVTIYPRDLAELERTCRELDAELAGEPGPYILSDLRWGDGPLHVRYGGFARRYCHDETGETVPAVEDPSGTLVPDLRGPVFAVPPWVELPDFLEPHVRARTAVNLADLPYTVDEALHFSNGGGVYVGTDKRTGRKVVLKEARPHAGMSGDGADAVTRLRRERAVLDRLAGLPAVPRLLDFLTVGDHEFLVMEHVDGEVLSKALAARYPLLGAEADAAALGEYARWATAVHDGVRTAIDAINGRGVVYGDLHMFNVIVRPDGRVGLVDFEVADTVGSGRRAGLGAVGYAAPRDRHGADIDRYALACLRLALFLPLEQLVGLDRAKAVEMAAVVSDLFPVDRRPFDRAARLITGNAVAPTSDRCRPAPDPAGWRQSRDSVARAIRASATPERSDRLFPGDIAQFRAGGINLAHGAAGVLYALAATDAGRHPDHEEWLVEKALAPADGTRIGFYDGLHGVAYVLAYLGYEEQAMKVVDVCLDEGWTAAGHDLYGGLAGMGLNFAHLAALVGDPALDTAAAQATELVIQGLGAVDDVAETSGGRHPRAGLMRGAAGRALLLVRMYERTGEAALLDHAATALRQDLRRCVVRAEDGQMQVNEGWRTMPYLATGSVGIGFVLARYLVHRHDDAFTEALPAIRKAASSIFYAQAGLFNGRAGMLLYLSDERAGGAVPPSAAAHVRRLDWHALTFQGDLAFPGDRLLRLSMDLATGSAGVLLALGAALHDAPVHLPFLDPPAATAALPRVRESAGRPIDDQSERR